MPPVRTSTRISFRPIELVDLDISGKTQLAVSGDIYPSTALVMLMKNKSELFQALSDYKNWTEMQTYLSYEHSTRYSLKNLSTDVQ